MLGFGNTLALDNMFVFANMFVFRNIDGDYKSASINKSSESIVWMLEYRKMIPHIVYFILHPYVWSQNRFRIHLCVSIASCDYREKLYAAFANDNQKQVPTALGPI